MCILFLAVNRHRRYPLVITANRDEFYERPALPSSFWSDCPDLLAGKDCVAGGTWLGLTRSGRFAALTNIREPDLQVDGAPSRGNLVFDALTRESLGREFEVQLRRDGKSYNGFNLIFGRWDSLSVYNNRNGAVTKLDDGFYGLSNAALDTPWPKLNRGVRALEGICQRSDSLDTEALLAIMRDETKAEDEHLPSTGISLEKERLLSSAFIRSPDYGTRCTTIITIDRDRKARWVEQSYELGELTTRQEFELELQY